MVILRALLKVFVFLFLILSPSQAYCPCEINKEKLGHATWYLLHEIAKQPDKNQMAFDAFVQSLSLIYPCKVCRQHFKENLKKYSLIMDSISMCNFHNHVNYQLNKTHFNCSNLV